MEFSVKAVARKTAQCLYCSRRFRTAPPVPLSQNNSTKSVMVISAHCCAVANWKAKVGQTLLLHHVPNILRAHLLIGCGKERELDERQYKQVIQKTINTLNDTGSMEAVCFPDRATRERPQHLLESASGGRNRQREALHLRSAESNKVEPRRPLRKMVFNVPTRRELTSGERAIQHGLAVASGIRRPKISATCRRTSVTPATWPRRPVSWRTPSAPTSPPASSANSR